MWYPGTRLPLDSRFRAAERGRANREATAQRAGRRQTKQRRRANGRAVRRVQAGVGAPARHTDRQV